MRTMSRGWTCMTLGLTATACSSPVTTGPDGGTSSAHVDGATRKDTGAHHDAGAPRPDATSPVDAHRDTSSSNGDAKTMHDGGARPDGATPEDASCSDGSVACNGACVDEQSSADNCGGCGAAFACASGTCSKGVCVPACSVGAALCDGGCVGLDTNQNCGGCGLTCSSCSNGECVVSLATGESIGGVAVNGQWVYWTDYFDDRVMRIPPAGPPDAATLIASNQSNALGVAIDSTSVYWTAQGTGHVVKASLSGANVTTIANASGTIPLPGAITVDGTGAYWVNGRGTVEEVPLDGPPDAATVLATAESPFAIAVDAANIYWTDTTAGTVLRRARASGTITTLASGQPSPEGMALAADDSSLYWANSGSGAGDGGVGNGAIMKVALADATVTTVAMGQSHPTGVAVDGATLYWTNAGLTSGTGTVMKLTAGGTPSTLASGLTSPDAIAVDATSVYWTQYEVIGSGMGSSLTRLTPK